jgi:pimeloyl-ACP methyl ester carboxylesterase
MSAAVRVRVHTLAPGAPGGPLVVLVHGLEDAWASWLPMAAELDPDWRLVALDLPWRAGNDYRWYRRPSGEWLADALDLLGARPDAMVAHSYGANAALELLCERDSRPGPAVALISPLYRNPRYPVTWRLFDRAREAFVEHIREGLRARMAGRAETTDPTVLAAMMSVALDRVGPSGFLAVFQQFTASAYLALDQVEAATLLVAGAQDPSLPPEAARALASSIPGARVRVNDGYDHFCHFRQARGVAAQVAEFIETACLSTGTVGER